MSNTTIDDVNFWIGRMMKFESVVDFHVHTVEGNNKGDGYLGEITFATVSANKNATSKNYNIVIKAAKKSDELRKQTPIKEAYDREIFMYSKVIPLLQEFQMSRSVENPFNNTAKCYYVCTEEHKEAVILQDLRSLGFCLHDRKKPMNFEHISLVLRSYGRFHAISLALRNKQPSLYKSITKNMTDVLGQFVEQVKMMTMFHQSYKHVKKILEADGENETLKKYENFEDEFEHIMMPKSEEDTDTSVILHGDCWNNNFIFKYKDQDVAKENPVDMCFLDFQLSRATSPVRDLSYFLYLCADKKILDNFDELLKIYHSSLSEYLTELGCDPSEIFPLEKLREHWKVHGKFGLILSLFVLKISLCESSEGPDFMETAEKGDGFENSLDIQMKDQEQYDKRIKDNFVHFAKEFL